MACSEARKIPTMISFLPEDSIVVREGIQRRILFVGYLLIPFPFREGFDLIAFEKSFD